ncbi:MAG: hypothetical protein Q9183_003464 [Haloplaca sp. 2 TL-2023]
MNEDHVEMLVAVALHSKGVTANDLADVLSHILEDRISDIDVYNFINKLKFDWFTSGGSAAIQHWEALLPHPTKKSDWNKLRDVELKFIGLLEQAQAAHHNKMQHDEKLKEKMQQYEKAEKKLLRGLKLEDWVGGRTVVEQMKSVGIFKKRDENRIKDGPMLAMFRRTARVAGGFLPGTQELREKYLEESRCEEALDDEPGVEGWIDDLPGPARGGGKGKSKGKYKAIEDVKLESEGKGKDLVKVEKEGKSRELVKVEAKGKEKHRLRTRGN